MHAQYENRYRGYLMDNHLPAPPLFNFKNFNASSHMPMLKKGNIDTFMLQAKSVWGYAYYPTKVGVMNPGLECDYFGQMVEACHVEGIEVVAYYSTGWDNVAARNHPQWCARKKDGSVLRSPNRGKDYWYWVCLSTGYRKYALEMIREIATTYAVDGFWIDILEKHHNEGMCYCQPCLEGIRELFGKDMAKEELTWQERLQWRQKLEDDMFAAYCEVVQNVRPGCPVIPNVSPWDVSPKIIEAVKYISTDRPLDTSWNMGIFFRGAGKKANQVMFGNLSRIYDPSPQAQCELVVSEILAQGGRPIIYSEPQNPGDGSLRGDFFRILGEVYEDIPRKQPYIQDTVPVNMVGVLASGSTHRMQWEQTGSEATAHQRSFIGALNQCHALHLPVECILDFNIRDLSRFDVMILPDCRCLSGTAVPALESYVEAGGTLICTYQTGLFDESGNRREDFALARIMGLNFERVYEDYAVNTTGSYLELEGEAWSPELLGLPFEAGPDFIATTSIRGVVLGRHILPTIRETTDQFYAWNPPPPGKRTDYPAIHAHQAGRGKVIYFSTPVFAYTSETKYSAPVFTLGSGNKVWPSRVIADLMRNLFPEPKVYVDGPPFVKASYFTREEDGSLIVHLVNSSPRMLGGVLATAACTLKLRSDFFLPAEVRTVFPVGKALEAKLTGRYCEVPLSANVVHTMLLCSPQDG